MRLVVPFFLIAVASGILSCKPTATAENCASIRTGQFYFYPSNTGSSYSITRDNKVQKESRLGSTDTSYWKISWTDSCNYSLDYMSGGGKEFETAPHVPIKVKFLAVTKQYYIMQVSSEELSRTLTDTIWRVPK